MNLLISTPHIKMFNNKSSVWKGVLKVRGNELTASEKQPFRVAGSMSDLPWCLSVFSPACGRAWMSTAQTAQDTHLYIMLHLMDTGKTKSECVCVCVCVILVFLFFFTCCHALKRTSGWLQSFLVQFHQKPLLDKSTASLRVWQNKRQSCYKPERLAAPG